MVEINILTLTCEGTLRRRGVLCLAACCNLATLAFTPFLTFCSTRVAILVSWSLITAWTTARVAGSSPASPDVDAARSSDRSALSRSPSAAWCRASPSSAAAITSMSSLGNTKEFADCSRWRAIDEESFEQRTLLLMLFGVDDSRRLWKRPAGVDGAESGLTILSSVKEVPSIHARDTGERTLRHSGRQRVLTEIVWCLGIGLRGLSMVRGQPCCPWPWPGKACRTGNPAAQRSPAA